MVCFMSKPSCGIVVVNLVGNTFLYRLRHYTSRLHYLLLVIQFALTNLLRCDSLQFQDLRMLIQAVLHRRLINRYEQYGSAENRLILYSNTEVTSTCGCLQNTHFTLKRYFYKCNTHKYRIIRYTSFNVFRILHGYETCQSFS